MNSSKSVRWWRNRGLLMILAFVGLKPGCGEVVSDFQQADELSHWQFANGPEFPGAKGSLGPLSEAGTMGAELRYDFSPPANSSLPFDPHYVSARRSLNSSLAANVLKISLAANSAHPRIRIVDATGQTLQYSVTIFPSLEFKQPQPLSRCFVPLQNPEAAWGGADDRIFHPPAKALMLLADATGQRGTGWVRFGNIELLASSPSVVSFPEVSRNFVTRTPRLAGLTERLGVNVHFTREDQALPTIVDAGFKWLRTDLEWEKIETVRGQPDFTDFTMLVDKAKTAGLRTVALVDYGNSLYTGVPSTPPTTASAIQAFSEFTAKGVALLSPKGTVFEIWNEPDLQLFWPGTAQAEEYGRLLRAAVTRSRIESSSAVLLSAGLSSPSPDNTVFWGKLESSGSFAGVSGLGVHLYTESGPETRWGDILDLKALAARDFPGGKLWCTEWGYSSTLLDPNKNGHGETGRLLQAVMTVRMLLVGWWADLPLLNIYDIRDDGDDPSNKVHNYGLLDRNFAEKPVLKAVRVLTGLTGSRSLMGMVAAEALPQGMHIAKLVGTSDVVWIVWLDERTLTDRIRLILPTDFQRVTDIFANDLPVVRSTDGTSVELRAASGPIYLFRPVELIKPPEIMDEDGRPTITVSRTEAQK